MNKEEIKTKDFDKKYKYLSLNNVLKDYKDWEVSFFLLTKEELNDLIKKTYNRMRLYNKKYKPKSWAGYDNRNGEDIK